MYTQQMCFLFGDGNMQIPCILNMHVLQKTPRDDVPSVQWNALAAAAQRGRTLREKQNQ